MIEETPKNPIFFDPLQRARNKKREAFYRERAAAALADENISATDDMLDGLANIGRRSEGGAMPSIVPAFHLNHIDRCNRIRSEASRVSRALNNLATAWNGITMDTQWEIGEEIESNGMAAEDVGKAINLLSEIVDRIASEPPIKKIQGNRQKPRAAWILLTWQTMKSTGNSMDMRVASRVISKVFDGDDKQAESVYQTIRNSEIR